MNESRQTVETDTLWLSNIRALNFRKPGHLRKYCNNENFPIYGIKQKCLIITKIVKLHFSMFIKISSTFQGY